MQRRLVLAVLLLGLAAPNVVSGASLDVAPVEVVVPSEGRPATVRVVNRGDEEVLVQAMVLPWVPPEELDSVRPVDDVIIVPPVFELPAGGRQVLRVASRRPLDSPREQAYRLTVAEVPRDIRVYNGVTVAVRLDLPLFITPPGAAPLAEWQVRPGEQGRAEVLVSNMGTARVVVREIGLSTLSGRELAQVKVTKTAIAGGRASWLLDAPMGALPDVVEVRAKTNRGPMVVEVRPGAG